MAEVSNGGGDAQLEVLQTPMPGVWCNIDVWGATLETSQNAHFPTFTNNGPTRA